MSIKFGLTNIFPPSCNGCNNSSSDQYQDFKIGDKVYAIYYTAGTQNTPNQKFKWYVLEGITWKQIFEWSPGSEYHCCVFSWAILTNRGCYRVEFGDYNLEFSIEAKDCCNVRRLVPPIGFLPCPEEFGAPTVGKSILSGGEGR